MFQSWSKKEVGKFILCFVCYFVLIIAIEIPGFASPLYWAIVPIFTAFVAAGPATCVLSMKRGFGSAAILPLLWLIVMRLLGELSMPLMWVGAIVLIVLAEVIHMAFGCTKLRGIRISAVIAALVPSVTIWPLYFQQARFVELAAEEMGADYAAGLAHYGKPALFVVMTVVSIIAALLSERISEKIAKVEAE